MQNLSFHTSQDINQYCKNFEEFTQNSFEFWVLNKFFNVFNDIILKVLIPVSMAELVFPTCVIISWIVMGVKECSECTSIS